VTVKVTAQAFEPWQELAAFEQEKSSLRGRSGASAVFVGSMRDFNEGDPVRAMTLEHYPGMTERHLEEICTNARERWDLLETLVIHRVGELAPGDPIVLVAVWSAHRAAAFEASRFIMEDLKSRAPFWKKELLSDGHRWVAENTPGTTSSGQ
jgi:molybdopterin synthase catalytic subunit